ncbi:ATP-binding protein [Nocardioides carbamazepini]|uniref:ATP-binding protein n=1 Tax=Nocardioides carbamazepini TaxID=2854259 RepID=UPI0021499CBD|nr:ATP-binding protein [Nocardioides carbamazepini]MCR1785416.1 ATP-binding protein [Nocardioides carbamazepini]
MAQDWDIAEPRADALIESLRAFGYSPEAAIADLVDNSVSAGAKRIAVDFAWSGANSRVTVSDDGGGMSENALVAAMRPGSTSPLEDRDASDLGRFGLGLKTASFSQARELTVVSKTEEGDATTRRWDLDTVAASGEWRLLRTAPAGAAVLQPPTTGGTTVTWSKLDRLVGDVGSDDAKAHRRFLDATARVQRHLEATFHRFLSGRGRLRISVNGQQIDSLDPFMVHHPATQQLDAEELPYKGSLIKVAPYVLPHRSKLDDEEMARGAGLQGWNQQQGFYVYRSGRLLVQGDWLGLGLSKDEHTKLARIAVEFPSSLDHAWQVDVKKSTARPPGELVEALRRIARATRSKAEEVYRHKGKVLARQNSQSFVFAWQEHKGRNGEIRYRVNRDHPVILAVRHALGTDKQVFERALRFIEETIPTSMIGVSIAHSVDNQLTAFGGSKREIRPLVDFAFRSYVRDGMTTSEALDRIAAAEPFSDYPEVIATLREELA